MLYTNKEYKNYKYVVSKGDNYLEMTNQRTAGNNMQGFQGEEIDTIYRYISDPDLVIEGTRTIRNYTTYPEIELSTSIFERNDISNILICVFIILSFLAILGNCITAFIQKGGIFRND